MLYSSTSAQIDTFCIEIPQIPNYVKNRKYNTRVNKANVQTKVMNVIDLKILCIVAYELQNFVCLFAGF